MVNLELEDIVNVYYKKLVKTDKNISKITDGQIWPLLDFGLIRVICGWQYYGGTKLATLGALLDVKTYLIVGIIPLDKLIKPLNQLFTT